MNWSTFITSTSKIFRIGLPNIVIYAWSVEVFLGVGPVSPSSTHFHHTLPSYHMWQHASGPRYSSRSHYYLLVLFHMCLAFRLECSPDDRSWLSCSSLLLASVKFEGGIVISGTSNKLLFQLAQVIRIRYSSQRNWHTTYLLTWVAQRHSGFLPGRPTRHCQPYNCQYQWNKVQ